VINIHSTAEAQPAVATQQSELEKEEWRGFRCTNCGRKGTKSQPRVAKDGEEVARTTSLNEYAEQEEG
jgi:hypothetical protein